MRSLTCLKPSTVDSLVSRRQNEDSRSFCIINSRTSGNTTKSRSIKRFADHQTFESCIKKVRGVQCPSTLNQRDQPFSTG
ncbi:hypothetical protein PAXRUDRAFT_545519 [Paxillus rubicundulus Ve08.2h10]|uniref:Uncharacterized protein n=1 Tax=Paxillus rubicundulus Ve08.2h10 TaxID=930991 RepID=A0A0D0E027_9AGAM|nr:hypothetical protein PAXRUDRAFT_545519 [Paxillus rubicundulus Ve08.2h10]